MVAVDVSVWISCDNSDILVSIFQKRVDCALLLGVNVVLRPLRPHCVWITVQRSVRLKTKNEVKKLSVGWEGCGHIRKEGEDTF